MSLIAIKQAGGKGIVDILESGSDVTLRPGDTVFVDDEHTALTTAIKEESALIIGVHGKFRVKVNNFFTIPDSKVEFHDTKLDSSELLDKLIVNVHVTHLDGGRRLLLVAPFSKIIALSGDKFEFPNSEVKHDDVHREGHDLLVYFEPGSTAEGKFITIANFFEKPEKDANSPLLILTDEKQKATDIIIHPEHNEQLQWHGVPITSATPGIPYGYYFYLTGDNVKELEVEVASLEGNLPAWLTLVQLGEGEFILSGTPPADYAAELNLEISAHERVEGANLHAKQQFQLKAILAERQSTERAMVTAVLAAELRGAQAQAHFAEGLVTGTESALSSMLGAQLAVIASVSSLSVISIAAAKQIQMEDFGRYEVQKLPDTEIESEPAKIQTDVGTISADREKSDLHIGTGTEMIPQEAGVRTKASDEGDTSSSIVGASFIIPPSIPTLGPSAQVLADLSNQRLAFTFKLVPDTFPVFESDNTFIPPEGILANDVDTLFNKAFMQVLSVNGFPMSIGVPFNLLSGAVLTLNADGSFTYDPNGQFEALPQGAIFPDFFFYIATNGLLTSFSFVNINVIGENDAPVIEQGQVFRVPETSDNGVPYATPEDVGNVQASDVDTGDVITYSIPIPGTLGGTGQLYFTIDPATGLITGVNASALDYESVPGHQFTLEIQATDILGLADNQVVTIRLVDVNEPPVIVNPAPFQFSVGEDLAVNSGVVGTVMVTDDDVDHGTHDSLTYQITDASVKNLFDIDSNGNIIVVKPLDYESQSVYTVEVTVHDNHTTDPVQLSDVQVFTVNVQDVNEAPVITNNAPLEFDIKENDGAGTDVGQVTFFDDDVINGAPGTDFISYAITGGTGLGLFSIDSDGNITVTGDNSFDYETAPTLTLEITIHDNHILGPELSDTKTFTINVGDVNEPPVITNSPLTFDVNEGAVGGDLIGVVTAADPDVDSGAGVDSLTYAITGGADKNDFNIDNDGNLTLRNGREFDYETKATYQVQVTVTDNHDLPGPNLSDTQLFTINVVDVNEAPMITNNNLTFDVDENVASGTLVGTVTASDDDVDNGAPGVDSLTYNITGGTGEGLFAIDPSSGNITVAGALDYEIASSYTVEVTVHDNHTTDPTVLQDVQIFTIDINDVNEPPMITNSPLTFDVNEGATGGDLIGVVTAADPDVDSGAGVDSLSYSITGGADANDFNIDDSGNLTLRSGREFDYETQATYQVQVTVTDNHVLPGPNLSDTQLFTINVVDVNEAPMITNSPLTFDVDENVASGTFVGTVNVSDDDVDNGAPGVDSLTFNITGGTGDGVFAIDPSSGNVTVVGALDYETTSSYTLEVTVHDNHTTDPTVLQDVKIFTIDINNLPEAPLMALNGENTINSNVAGLSVNTLSLLGAVAVQFWSLHTLSAEQLHTLSNLTFNVTDLPDGMLAMQSGDNIIVDVNAANYGWFVDTTPLTAEEFANQLGDNGYQASDGSEASGHMDLYTVLMHEIGHAIGYDDVPYDASSTNLMASQLDTGTRILPEDNIVNGDGVNDLMIFSNISDTHTDAGAGVDTVWFANDNQHVDLRGADIFTDVEVINLQAIKSEFGNTVSLDANEVHSINDHGPLTIDGGVHDTVQLAAADGWFISGVDASHTQFSAASGSIVNIDNDVSVVMI